MRLKKKVRVVIISILSIIYLILMATSFVGATARELVFKDIAMLYTIIYMILVLVVEYLEIRR